MPEIVRVAQEQTGGDNNWLVLILFIVAGLLVGGTWSAYQNSNKFLTVLMAVLAAVALVGAVLWMTGVMG